MTGCTVHGHPDHPGMRCAYPVAPMMRLELAAADYRIDGPVGARWPYGSAVDPRVIQRTPTGRLVVGVPESELDKLRRLAARVPGLYRERRALRDQVDQLKAEHDASLAQHVRTITAQRAQIVELTAGVARVTAQVRALIPSTEETP